MRSEDQEHQFLLSLEANKSLDELITTIILSGGFNFNLLLCQSSYDVKSIIGYINEKLLMQEQKKKIRFLSSNLTNSIEQFLDEIYTLPEVCNNSEIVVIDFTSITTFSKTKAELFFSKLNLMRNRLANSVQATFVLAITKEYKTSFIHGSPDIFSIVSSVSLVEWVGKIDEELIDDAEVKQIDIHKKDELIEKCENLRSKYMQNREDYVGQKKYLLVLQELGKYCEKYDSLHDAHKYYKKLIEIAETISDKRPDSIDAQRDVSVSLNNVANIYLQKGDVQLALDNYSQSLKIRETISDKRPDSIDAQRDVSVSLDKVANIYLQKGDVQLALDNYSQSLKIAETISDKRPDSIDAQRDLGVSYIKIADACEKLSDFTSSKEFFKKAQNLFGKLNLKSIENFDDLLRYIEQKT